MNNGLLKKLVNHKFNFLFKIKKEVYWSNLGYSGLLKRSLRFLVSTFVILFSLVFIHLVLISLSFGLIYRDSLVHRLLYITNNNQFLYLIVFLGFQLGFFFF
jgi:hypothetical protein